MIALGSGLVLFGLGWISTEDIRALAGKPPTITERVTDAAGSAVAATREKSGEIAEATKETTGGWISTAKGWFVDDEPE